MTIEEVMSVMLDEDDEGDEEEGMNAFVPCFVLDEAEEAGEVEDEE